MSKALTLIVALALTLFGGVQTQKECHKLILKTKSWGKEISWKFGSCESPQGYGQNINGKYASYKEYTIDCCQPAGIYELDCKDKYGDGWHGGSIVIGGSEYCKDFLRGHSKKQRVQHSAIDILKCKSISLKSWQGKYMVAEPNGDANANRIHNLAWEKWLVVAMPGGKIALKGAHGKFLVAESNGAANANRLVASTWESFQAIPRGGNKFAFKSHHNKYLVAEPDGKLNANRNKALAWEEFQVTCN